MDYVTDLKLYNIQALKSAAFICVVITNHTTVYIRQSCYHWLYNKLYFIECTIIDGVTYTLRLSLLVLLLLLFFVLCKYILYLMNWCISIQIFTH